MFLSHCHLISALDILEIGKAAGTEVPLSPALCGSYTLAPASVNSLGQHQREGVDSLAGWDGTGPLADPSSALGPAARGSPQGHLGSSQGPSGVPSSAQGLSIPSHHRTQQGPPAGEGLSPDLAQPQPPASQRGEEQLLGRADNGGNSLGSFLPPGARGGPAAIVCVPRPALA